MLKDQIVPRSPSREEEKVDPVDICDCNFLPVEVSLSFIISSASIFCRFPKNANNIIYFVCIALFSDEQTSTEGKFKTEKQT